MEGDFIWAFLGPICVIILVGGLGGGWGKIGGKKNKFRLAFTNHLKQTPHRLGALSRGPLMMSFGHHQPLFHPKSTMVAMALPPVDPQMEKLGEIRRTQLGFTKGK